jgi:hypothetical protein
MKGYGNGRKLWKLDFFETSKGGIDSIFIPHLQVLVSRPI